MSLLHDDGEDFEALDAALSFVDAYIASPAAVVQDGVSSSDDAMLGDDLDELLRTTLSPSTSSSSGGEFTHEIDTTSRRQLMLPSPLAPLAANMTAPDVAKVKENGRFQGGCRKSHCQAATNAAVATKRVKVNPNRARNERKNELAYLRNKVTQMETELGELHTRHHMGGTALTVGIDYFVSPSGPKESGLALTVANSAPDIPPFWRDMATRQKLRRDKAERENTRLKLVLEGQVKLARSMETLLQKRARQQVSECAGHRAMEEARTVAFTQEDPMQSSALSQLLLDDESDGQEEEAELQKMMESLSWVHEGVGSSRGKSRRRAHNDRHDEVEFLRIKVQQMEEELRALRLQHLDTMVPMSVSPGPAATLAFSSQAFGFPVSSPQTPETPPIWDLAARQQRWRERAVRENTRLRVALDTQAGLARSMEAQLGKRIREQLAGTAFGDLSGVDRGPDFALESETAEALRHGLDTAFEELDTVFGSNGLDQVETPYTEARIREGASGMYLDIFANKLLPFDFETTATATWNHYRGVERRRGNLYQNLTQDEETCSDTVVEEVAMKFTGKSTNADFRVKQALRRYVDADRQVVVWVSKAEAVEQQSSAYSNFAFVDKGYVVVKKPTLPEQDRQCDVAMIFPDEHMSAA
ncbi:hypothetical protein KRP22_014555 [Phytophthora ramorum]|nr:hypothetical protein KRP22_8842 [Phytophthora ramorum]